MIYPLEVIKYLFTSKNKNASTLRGASALCFLIIATSLFVSEVLIPFMGLGVPVFNSDNPGGFTNLLLLALCGVAISLAMPSPSTVLFVGAICGGAAANTISRMAFGPVADYLYLPGSGDRFLNLADIAILFGITIISIVFLRLVFDFIKTELQIKRLKRSRERQLHY